MNILADIMTNTQVSYLCPCCSKRHWHGNGGDHTANRVECRGSHCKATPGDVRIHITEQTVRQLKSKRKHTKA
eukprot:COSAG05_NODE_1844_length_3977_cov_2.730015_1_plen_73_part_00